MQRPCLPKRLPFLARGSLLFLIVYPVCDVCVCARCVGCLTGVDADVVPPTLAMPLDREVQEAQTDTGVLQCAQTQIPDALLVVNVAVVQETIVDVARRRDGSVVTDVKFPTEAAF